MIEIEFSFDESLLGKVERAADEAAGAMAAVIQEGAQERVPVDSGALKKSGTVKKTGKGSAAVVYGGPSAGYAGVVHSRPGKQFLRDAAMDTGKLGEAVAEAYRRRLR